MQLYDEGAGRFVADRYVVGECPVCHAQGAYGDQCEKCGSSLSATDLINPRCAETGNIPVLKETKHWYLPLENYQKALEEWILEGHKEWKTNVYGQCKSWLDLGLQPRAVTRDLDWGIPVPVEGIWGLREYAATRTAAASVDTTATNSYAQVVCRALISAPASHCSSPLLVLRATAVLTTAHRSTADTRT